MTDKSDSEKVFNLENKEREALADYVYHKKKGDKARMIHYKALADSYRSEIEKLSST